MDDRFKSRKYRLTLLALLAFIAGFILGGVVPAVAGLYPTFIGAVLGLVGLYFGGNITQKHIVKLPGVEVGGEIVGLDNLRRGNSEDSGEDSKQSLTGSTEPNSKD